MNETDKLIEEQLKKLPPNLQRAINAVPWKALVQEIGKTNVLDVEQIVSLEQETMFIIYAFESPKDYVANKIFNPILQKSEEPEKSIKTKTESPAPSSAPEIPPVNLPMVEQNVEVHDVPHVEPTTDNRQSTTSTIKQEPQPQ